MSKTFREIHMTGEGFRTLAIYRLFFARALRDSLKLREDYDREVAEWYAENPGYQYPACIHGSSLTTDYDNICGGCEDGSTAIEEAIVAARTDFLRFNERWEWVQAAPADLSHEVRMELFDWTTRIFPSPKTKTEEVAR